MLRERSCNNPEPSGKGESCSGSVTEVEYFNNPYPAKLIYLIMIIGTYVCYQILEIINKKWILKAVQQI